LYYLELFIVIILYWHFRGLQQLRELTVLANRRAQRRRMKT